MTITERRTHELAPLRLTEPTLTLRGKTAPRSVVEAMTGNLCPPDNEHRYGGFHSLERADAQHRFTLTGLVSGILMLGADGRPGHYAPRCWTGYRLRADAVRVMPLAPGGAPDGRLVYASTGTPVITTLSYELSYPPGSDRNPTEGHPARARARLASGEFEITRLAAASVTGGLVNEAYYDKITDLRSGVIHPYPQEGTS